MASPFRVFRRHQKVLMAVACVVGVFAFVLSDSLSYIMGGKGGRGATPTSSRPKDHDVAVHWNGGRLTNAELNQLAFRRRVTNSFQRQVHDTGAQAEQMVAITTGVPPKQLTVQPVVGPDQLEDGVERDVVRTRILADLARKAGMSVSDEEIRRYLYELGRGRVTPEQMQQLIRRSQSSGPISAEYIFNALREELLARYYYNSHSFAAASVMPEQQWEDWLRVNDRIAVEAAALPTESYLVDVKEPTDAELTEFYDKFKAMEPRPDMDGNVELPSPNPAFGIPRKIEFQFVRAEYEKFVAEANKEVTDEQIQKYYEANKDPYYIKLDTGLLDKEQEKKPVGETDGKQDAGDGKQPAAEAAKSDEKAADGKQPAATPVVPNTEKSGGSSASLDEPRQNVFKLASFEQQPADAKNGIATQPPAALQLGQPATVGADTAAAAGQGEVGKADDAAKQAEAPKKPVEYLPLNDELREKIREILRPNVSERIKTVATQLQSELSTEFGKYYRATFEAKEAKRQLPSPPAVLTDLAPLAEKNGLDFKKIGPISQFELREDKTLGQIVDNDGSGLPLFVTLFGKDADLYKPFVTSDFDKNYYVIVKTADTPSRVPTLAEIRDEVVKAWRFSKASELALKAAEEVAKKLQGTGTSLKEHYADNAAIKVVTTDQFAWLTGGEVSAVGGQFRQQPYRLSQPDEVTDVDTEFMKTVFNLDDGQYGSVLNHPHNIAYVVRIADHQYSPDKLHELYLAESSMWLGQNAMTNAHRQIADALIAGAILKDAGYAEDRPLDRPDASSEE